MISKYHNHKLQTNPWHHEEEPHNNQKTPGRQTNPSRWLQNRMDIKYCTTKHRTITETHNGSNNQQRNNKNRTPIWLCWEVNICHKYYMMVLLANKRYKKNKLRLVRNVVFTSIYHSNIIHIETRQCSSWSWTIETYGCTHFCTPKTTGSVPLCTRIYKKM